MILPFQLFWPVSLLFWVIWFVIMPGYLIAVRSLIVNSIDYIIIDKGFVVPKETFNLAPFLFKEIYHDFRYVIYEVDHHSGLNQCELQAKVSAAQYYKKAKTMMEQGKLLTGFNDSRQSLLLFPTDSAAMLNEEIRLKAMQAGFKFTIVRYSIID